MILINVYDSLKFLLILRRIGKIVDAIFVSEKLSAEVNFYLEDLSMALDDSHAFSDVLIDTSRLKNWKGNGDQKKKKRIVPNVYLNQLR